MLQGLVNIWPGGSTISGINLGDVWPHFLLRTNYLEDEYSNSHTVEVQNSFGLGVGSRE
ncbi:MAG: hypothetical protein AB4080_01620 [Trichodesmium sp.]